MAPEEINTSFHVRHHDTNHLCVVSRFYLNPESLLLQPVCDHKMNIEVIFSLMRSVLFFKTRHYVVQKWFTKHHVISLHMLPINKFAHVSMTVTPMCFFTLCMILIVLFSSLPSFITTSKHTSTIEPVSLVFIVYLGSIFVVWVKKTGRLFLTAPQTVSILICSFSLPFCFVGLCDHSHLV